MQNYVIPRASLVSVPPSKAELHWLYWMTFYDRHSNTWPLYIGSSARQLLDERIQEHRQVKEACQVVFAAQVPRAKEVETAMHVMCSPYRHRTLPDSFIIDLDQAYHELLPLVHRLSDGRVIH